MSEFKDTVSLREHLEARICDLHRLVEEKFHAHAKALELAAQGLETRLDHLNELRQAVNDQERRYATKESVELRLDRIDIDIRKLLSDRDVMQGKASMVSVVIGYIIALASLILGILHIGVGVGK